MIALSKVHAILQPRYGLIFSLIAMAAVIAVWGIGAKAASPIAFYSAEVRFADPSQGGMDIVPASCPSDPHSEADCLSKSKTKIKTKEPLPGGGGPPNPPDIDVGQCVVGRSFSIRMNSTDPDGDQLRYFMWHSESQGGSWTELSPSGVWHTEPYTANLAGAHEVRIYSFDESGLSSSWSSRWYICTEPGTASSQCSTGYFCSGSDLYYRSQACTETFVQRCAYECVAGACIPPPIGAPTASIQAVPSLVNSGQTAQVSWSSTNVTSCSVSEDNPTIDDAWSGETGARTTSGIRQETTYTLVCIGNNGQQVTDSATVKVAPKTQEI